MDKMKAHDVIHVWHGNKAENCPVCNGTMTADDQIVNAAQEIATTNYYPRINPELGYNEVIACDENGKPIKKEEVTLPSADAPKEPVKAGEGAPKNKPQHPAVSVMTDVMSFSEDSKTVPTKIKIIPTGKFNTAKYGELEITKENLLEMKKNFEAGVRAGGTSTGLPIDIEHGDTQHRDAAAGWMKALDIQDDGAYAEVDWTDLGKDLLGKGIYKFFSPEFTFDYVDNEQSYEISNVCIGGGLVNKPLFDHSLPPLVMSEDGTPQNLTKGILPHMLFISNHSSAEVPTDSQSNSSLIASEKEIIPMDLQTVLQKEKSARTSDEQAFIAQNVGQLTEEQKTTEGFNVAAAEEVKEVVAPVAPVVEAVPAATPAITASEGITASELNSLRADAEKGRLAFAELQRTQDILQTKEITEKVKGFVFSEKGGKIAPAQVDPIVKLMKKMSEEDRTAFTNVLESLPDTKIFGEKGSDADVTESTAKDRLVAMAHNLVKENKEQGRVLAFSEALQRVTNENPDIYMEQFKK